MSSDSNEESSDLQTELDNAKLQLLSAVDAAQGAEAERAVVEARVRELEHQHHMLKVERDELRRQVAQMRAERTSVPVAIVRRARGGLRKLADAVR